MRILYISGVLVVGALLGTGVANATVSEFLTGVADELPYVYSEYSQQQLISEGYRICQYEAQGMEEYDETTRVVEDLPMSRDAAITLEVLSSSRLGC